MQQYVIIKNLASYFCFKMQLLQAACYFWKFQFCTKLNVLEYELKSNHSFKEIQTILRLSLVTEDGSTEAILKILYGPNLILGGFGSYMF